MGAVGGDSPREEPADGSVGERIPQLSELLGVAQDTARGILEAEEALHGVRQRFEHTQDTDARGALAAEALDHVERQLELTRERRRLLDSVEGKLWSRRNRLERFLIHARGTAWWHARRSTPEPKHQQDAAAWNA
jgi:hypothetical protein